MADEDSIPSLPEDEDSPENNSSVALEKTPLLLQSSQSHQSYHSDNITIQNNEITKDQLSEESDEYDVEINPIKSEIKPGNSSSFGAVFLVTNAAMGAGMLTFPYAFYLAGGWYFGMLTELIILPFIITGLMILAYCAELKQAITCEDTLGKMLGPGMKLITEICVCIYCFGCCVTLLVVIGDQIEDITAAFSYHSRSLSRQWWAKKMFLMPIASLILIYPWLYLRRIGFLSYTSFFGVGSCVYICIIVVVKYFIIQDPASCNAYTSNCSYSWITSFNAIPFVCFAFQCHVSAIPIYSGLKKRTVKNFFGIVVSGVIICTIIYSLTGTFGVMTFSSRAECLNSDILRNYCPNDIAVSIARGMLFLSLITSYPILAFCGRLSLDGLVMRLQPFLTNFMEKRSYQSKINLPSFCTIELLRFIIEANIWMFLSLALALFVPQIKYVVSPLGSLAAVFIFVLPGMCLLKLSLQGHFCGRWKNICAAVFSCIMITIGFFILGDNLVYDIMKDFGKA